MGAARGGVGLDTVHGDGRGGGECGDGGDDAVEAGAGAAFGGAAHGEDGAGPLEGAWGGVGRMWAARAGGDESAHGDVVAVVDGSSVVAHGW